MSSYVVNVTDAEFESRIINHNGVALVDFWAPWCGPCRSIAPLIEKIGQEFHGDVLVSKVNVDENPQISAQLGIRSIPTLMIFKRGELLKEMHGAPDPHALVDLLEDALADAQ